MSDVYNVMCFEIIVDLNIIVMHLVLFSSKLILYYYVMILAIAINQNE